jgi:hypothetical protein
MSDAMRDTPRVEILNLRELEAIARARLPQLAWDYYASGADDETCLARRASRCITACSSTSRVAT